MSDSRLNSCEDIIINIEFMCEITIESNFQTPIKSYYSIANSLVGNQIVILLVHEWVNYVLIFYTVALGTLHTLTHVPWMSSI